MGGERKGINRLEWSAIATIIGVLLLFSMAIGVTLIAPRYIDPSWNQASSTYQVQMHEVSDPNVYVSTSNPGGWGLQYVNHLKQGNSLLSFRESEGVRIRAQEELNSYITRENDQEVTLTSRLLLLRPANDQTEWQKELQEEWKQNHPNWESEGLSLPFYTLLELYDPEKTEAFAVTESDGVLEPWVRSHFTLLGDSPPFDISQGTIYIQNPREYRISEILYQGAKNWIYDENGEPIPDLQELKEGKLRFLSRESLIKMGEDVYRVEGCWYCHTDQTRTLVQDTVLNGSAEYPAPPSSANEYIYQQVTFPGTRRIGPDLSRVGIKRSHRDWHMSHFWSPKTESRGSIMPSFGHFFDDDPTGTSPNPYGIPNFKFEAIYQYLMTKGTRITPPDQAWWLGLDPIQTIDIIEGRKGDD
ncbi:MAG: hypothetical protein K940chlam9_01161 [Chlamydiae bacterium]|nr:hypothetical protein [Chlamydiota bacterium]